MLHLLDGYDGSGRAQHAIMGAIEALHGAVVASKGKGDVGQVARAEADVKAQPDRIRFNAAGEATVYAAGRSYQGGRFEVPPLASLRARARAARERAGGALRLWVVDGSGPVTDIGALQATAAPGSLFQVASQFNCLESPGAFVTDVAEYLHDPTQGPRASISAFPGTLVRHYAAPLAGGRAVQATDRPQIDLLADVCGPGLATVVNGYLRSSDIADAGAFARSLEERFDAIRVGVHSGVEVVLGADWAGAVEATPHRTIAQVFTSTVAAGMYGSLDEGDRAFATVVQQLQRGAYLGTLLAAAALGVDRVALTLIGGGVFANPIPTIWEAILWACDQVAPLVHRDLTVVVNGRNLGEQLSPRELRTAARTRGGALMRIERDGGVSIEGG